MVPGVAEEHRPRTETAPGSAFGLPLRAGSRLSVFTIDGRQLFEGTIPASGLSPVPGLRPGVYFYRLTSSGDRSLTGKFLVLR